MNTSHDNVSMQAAVNNYLSCIQLKYDCETVCSFAKSLQQDGVTVFGVIPCGY